MWKATYKNIVNIGCLGRWWDKSTLYFYPVIKLLLQLEYFILRLLIVPVHLHGLSAKGNARKTDWIKKHNRTWHKTQPYPKNKKTESHTHQIKCNIMFIITPPDSNTMTCYCGKEHCFHPKVTQLSPKI